MESKELRNLVFLRFLIEQMYYFSIPLKRKTKAKERPYYRIAPDSNLLFYHETIAGPNQAILWF
jgi:hypothetical protein